MNHERRISKLERDVRALSAGRSLRHMPRVYVLRPGDPPPDLSGYENNGEDVHIKLIYLGPDDYASAQAQEDTPEVPHEGGGGVEAAHDQPGCEEAL
jgi:hypothetical protein